MRVIAGYLGGRNFESPHGNRTHPMSEKIRGAIFNSLGDIEGLTVLDAYAGTGALAFEAISRNAKSAVAIDIDNAADRIISENIEALGIGDKVKNVKAGITAWSRRHQTEKFNIIFLDPPYDNVEPKDIIKVALGHSTQGSIVVLSLPPTVPLELSTTNYQKLSSKVYGDATVSIYRRK